MESYDKQYTVEQTLFGAAYPEFEAFVAEHAVQGGTALDIGCGQGRDALMLAQAGYQVTGVDSSAVGIAQMETRAAALGVSLKGIVADFYAFRPTATYDAIVLDSILHFGKADRDRELALLGRLADCLKVNGYLFVFVHKSPAKEKILRKWLAEQSDLFTLVKDGCIDYVYEERQSDFRSQFQMYLFFVQRKGGSRL